MRLPDRSPPLGAAQGYWAVYRVSFSLAGFFLLMLLLTCGKSSFSASLHRGYWFGKFFIITAIFVASLFASNDFFAVYAWIARLGAPLFIIYQMICFIDFGYSANEKMLEKDDNMDDLLCCTNTGSLWKAVMLSGTLGLLTVAITGIVLLYKFYPSECAFNATATTTTLIFSLINFGVTVSPIAPHGTILVAALIFTYSTYLAFAAVSAYPDGSCNPFMNDSDEDVLWLVVSCAMASVTVAYMAWKMGKRNMGGNMMSGKQADGTEAKAPVGGAHTDAVTVEVDNGTGQEEVEDASFLSYHFVMLLAALYAAMLVTDWGSSSDVSASTRHNVGYASAWLLLSANWVCQGLYFWTLVARAACPNRDFD